MEKSYPGEQSEQLSSLDLTPEEGPEKKGLKHTIHSQLTLQCLPQYVYLLNDLSQEGKGIKKVIYHS